RDEIEPDLARRSGSPVSALHGFRDRKHAYRRALRRARPDVVVFNHVASRPVGTLVRLHRRIAPDVPAIGIAHSWHEITQTEGPRAEKELAQVRHAVAALDAITFGSHHCKREGEALG